VDFKGDLFSMKHKNTIKPSRSVLQDGIFLTKIATPSGTAILVMEYMSENPNPEANVDYFLKLLMEAYVEDGDKYKVRKVEKVVDGKNIRGKQVVTAHPEWGTTTSVMAYGGKDKGVLIMTTIFNDEYKNEQHIISDLWQYLRISFD